MFKISRGYLTHCNPCLVVLIHILPSFSTSGTLPAPSSFAKWVHEPKHGFFVTRYGYVACGNLAVSYVNSHLNIYQVNHRTTCAMASIAMLVCWRVDVEVLVHPFFIQHGNRSNIHMIWDPIVQVPC